MSIYADIEKRLGSFHLNVRFEAGDEVLSLLGASGCGKSMTLKCIAGIVKPDRGRIIIDGETVFDSEKHIDLSPQKRQTGFLFQNYALFPNMTVKQNILAGARRTKDHRMREEKALDIMERFGLSELSGLYPAQLSGGQQQRTALARILISGPRILLLDEPFSALDEHLRAKLEDDLRNVIGGFNKTVILVSHDRGEVYRLSDKTAVMNNGSIDVCGDTREVFLSPKTCTAAMLTGCENISAAEISGSSETEGIAGCCTLSLVDLGLKFKTWPSSESHSFAGFHAEDVCIGGENSTLCDVLEVTEDRKSCIIKLQAPDGAKPFCMNISREQWNVSAAAKIPVSIPEDKIMLLD